MIGLDPVIVGMDPAEFTTITIQPFRLSNFAVALLPQFFSAGEGCHADHAEHCSTFVALSHVGSFVDERRGSACNELGVPWATPMAG